MSVFQLADVDLAEPGDLRKVGLSPAALRSQITDSPSEPDFNINCHSSMVRLS